MNRRSLGVRALLIAILVACSAAPARAQYPLDHSFSPQLFHPAAGPDEFFTVEPARPLEHMNFSLGLWLNYSRAGFALLQVGQPDANGKRPVGTLLANLVRDSLAADLVFSIGFINRLQLSVGVPVTVFQNGDSTITFPGSGNTYSLLPPGATSLGSATLGDPWIALKARVVGAGDRGFQLAVAGNLTLPLSAATPDAFGGGGGTFTPIGDSGQVMPSHTGVAVAGGLQLLGGYEANRWRVGAKVGVLLRSELSHFLSTTIGHELDYGAAFAYDVVADKKVSLVVELNGRTGLSGKSVTTVDATALEGDLGVKLRLARPVFLTIGIGNGIIRGIGAPQPRVFAGLTWAPDRRDRDRDGVPDIDDKCPDQPEDRDGFRDDDGCPDPDNDGDGIPDARDKCPNDAEDFDGFQDDDGCPELDNDGDGLPDVKDACPLDKEDGKPPKPNDGCPADKMDSDGDGIPDGKDKCPTDPEDKDGFEDDDGCPDFDNDGDGIPDQYDKCPNEPEDNLDGFEDDDGCPEPDNDHDGILDAKDKCPNEPETLNGVADDDGCPDHGPPLKVQIVGDEIVILEKVFFKTASAVIDPRSHNLLDQVASVLKMHHEITRVLIEGHTDAKGNAAKNLKLSQDRADAVRRYLMGHGLAADRLSAHGFGGTVPVGDNKTERGREANRRVQFRVMETKKAPDAAAPVVPAAPGAP